MGKNEIEYDPETECCGSYSSEAGCCPWGDKKPEANDNKGEKKEI